jgi:hypothetical protein
MRQQDLTDAFVLARKINDEAHLHNTSAPFSLPFEKLLLLVDATLLFAKKNSDDPHDMAHEIAATAMADLSTPVVRTANARQVAGEHYGLSKFQHWDMVSLFKLDYFQGQITKYVLRWKKKNGVTDLEKAQHFLEKYLEEVKAGRITKED